MAEGKLNHEAATTKTTKSTKTTEIIMIYYNLRVLRGLISPPPWLLLLTLGIIIYIGSACWGPAILDDADSVHAEAAREMAQSGDFITLHADGIRYLEKAPFIYWAVAAGFRLLGSSEPAARIPLALAT